MPLGEAKKQLKTPYRDGTTHIVLDPLDLMARLAALVPPLRMQLTCYHGVLVRTGRCAHHHVGASGLWQEAADGRGR